MKNEDIDLYINQLLAKFSHLTERQGTEAFDNFFSASQYIPAYQWILNNVPKTARILDWGCGTGHFSDFLVNYGYDVTPYGFDMPELLEFSNPKALSKFVKANESTILPFKNNSFDIVLSIGVLEHVREFGGTEIDSLKEINRILDRDGIFFCYHLPNQKSWIEVLSSLINKWHHEYRYSKIQIAEMVHQSGFQLDTCYSYGFLPRNIFGKNYFLNMISKAIPNKALELIDDSLERLIRFANQNWLFVAKK